VSGLWAIQNTGKPAWKVLARGQEQVKKKKVRKNRVMINVKMCVEVSADKPLKSQLKPKEVGWMYQALRSNLWVE
jgi:hypothetical protein